MALVVVLIIVVLIAIARGIVRLLQHKQPSIPAAYQPKQVFGYILVHNVPPVHNGNRASLPFHDVTYVGISNDPKRRAHQHWQDGKRGVQLIITGPMTRPNARRWEADMLKQCREQTGRNPIYNKTLRG